MMIDDKFFQTCVIIVSEWVSQSVVPFLEDFHGCILSFEPSISISSNDCRYKRPWLIDWFIRYSIHWYDLPLVTGFSAHPSYRPSMPVWVWCLLWAYWSYYYSDDSFIHSCPTFVGYLLFWLIHSILVLRSIWCDAMRRDTMRYHAIPCDTMRYHAIPCTRHRS